MQKTGKEQGQVKEGKKIEENDRVAKEKKDAVQINALFYFFMSVYK